MTKKSMLVFLIIFLLGIGIVILIIKSVEVIKPKLRIKARIAIVIDDWGYTLDNLGIMEEINYPITAAILPNVDYSKRIAQALHSKGREIILHLPMEPKERYGLEKDTILVSTDESKISDIIANDLSNIVYAKGISNHMGSRVTSNLKTMEMIFKELKKRHLYFLDSFVTPESVCVDLAHKMNIISLKRDVFLDNKGERNYIKQQLYKLKAKAKAAGFAIGIGHDRRITLETLKEVIPEIAKDGYRFVYLSELTK